MVGLCDESHAGAQKRQHEPGLDEEPGSAARGDRRRRLRLGRGNNDNRRLDCGGFVGGYCPAARVVVNPGRLSRNG